jgi:predicted ABC-type sugar transport system permease subunit
VTTYTLQSDPGSRSDDRHDAPVGPGIEIGLPGLLVVAVVVIALCWLVGKRKGRCGGV